MAQASEDVHSREALQGSWHWPGQREPVHQAGAWQDCWQHAQQLGSQGGGHHSLLSCPSRPALHVFPGHQQAGKIRGRWAFVGGRARGSSHHTLLNNSSGPAVNVNPRHQQAGKRRGAGCWVGWGQQGEGEGGAAGLGVVLGEKR